MRGDFMQNEIIANMTNLGDSGQDEFVQNWAEYAKLTLYEKGVSKKFINTEDAAYILAKIVTDIVEDGELSKTAENMIATLRINHPHSEDL
jgi:hypothetical protein